MTDYSANPTVPRVGEEGGPSGPVGGRVCPFLGRSGDRATTYLQPDGDHRCYGAEPALRVALAHQSAHCFAAHEACPTFKAVGDGARAGNGAVAVSAWPSRLGEAPGDGPSAAALTEAMASEEDAAEADAGATTVDSLPRAVAEHFASLTLEGWTVYAVTATVLGIAAYFAFLGARGVGQGTPTPEPRIQARVLALLATDTPTALPAPTRTPRPTRPAEELPRETPPIPEAPPGGDVVVLTPGERDVASVSSEARLPNYGKRELHVGRYEGNRYVGIVSIPLEKLRGARRVTEVQLELVGLSDLHLDHEGEFTIELLPEVVDRDWRNLTYDLVLRAPSIEPPIRWSVSGEDLRRRGVTVLPFDDRSRGVVEQRLTEDQPRLSFRIEGPPEGEAAKDDVFTWDTGYGEGFGTRPKLRVAAVLPSPTPRAVAGGRVATPLPLIIWEANPTPAPTTTPMPAGPPRVLTGMILFLSDRFGQTALMVHDPASDRTGRVTQSWVYAVAAKNDHQAAGLSVGAFGRPCGEGGSCTQLVVKDLTTGVEGEVTQPGWLHYNPAFSADGQWIAYVSNITGNDEVFKIRPDGTDNTRLTENVWEWDKHPSFSPDGSEIAFWSNRDGRKQIYVMKADASGVHNVSQSPYNDWDPVWVK